MLSDLLMHWLINEQGRSWKSEKISPTFHFYLVTERSYGLENKYVINSSHGLIWIGLWSFERSIYYIFGPNACHCVCMSEQLRLSRSCSNQVFQANAFIHVSGVPRWGTKSTIYSVLCCFYLLYYIWKKPPKPD